MYQQHNSPEELALSSLIHGWLSLIPEASFRFWLVELGSSFQFRHALELSYEAFSYLHGHCAAALGFSIVFRE